MSKNLFKTNILKDVILGEKIYNKLFHRKDKAPFFETEDPVEWVEPKINPLSEPIDNLGAVDVEEWNQNTHNIFQNLSEEKRVEKIYGAGLQVGN